MLRKWAAAGMVLLPGVLAGVIFAATAGGAAPESGADVEAKFASTVHPFIDSYCISCHSGEKPDAELDLIKFKTMANVVDDQAHWSAIRDKLMAKQMPPKTADQPPEEERQRVVEWIKSMRGAEARKHAGDPGTVLARRLSNAEYNYTIRDLTGVDMKPTREFPVDPANPAGFDNSGESLAMSPSLMNKYLQAAREVASHMVLRMEGIEFAPHPMLVETDRDKYCINNIITFYHSQDTDYADYFAAAWRFKHRAALGNADATLEQIAGASKVSPKYLGKVWTALETREEVGPLAKLQGMWAALPEHDGDAMRAGCAKMRDWVVGLRKKLEPRFAGLMVKGLSATSQPFAMWRNREYATHRMTFDKDALQVEGETKAAPTETTAAAPVDPDAAAEEPTQPMPRRKNAPDPDLKIPNGERAKYEAAFGKFCAVFPDAFYISERGRNYLDPTKDKGRLLSAGFHNLMGYFRDDQPLYELMLDENQQKQLDTMWKEMDSIAAANVRTYVQFFFNESGEARGTSRESEGPRPADKDVTSEAMIRQTEAAYMAKAKASGNAVAIKAIEDHFNWVNDCVRGMEKARVEAEPRHLEALLKFASRAYRRQLTSAERADFVSFYRELRDKTGLDHEEAMRDTLVSVLMSPDFCYRIDLVPEGDGVRPLTDYALASRLSYFLWSSMPDEELLAHAAAGDLHRPEVIAAQARRMLKDDRVRGMAVEFGGGWLDFRRFEELNTVDRERFTNFTNELRTAMYEEPVRFMIDVMQNNRPILDFVYGKHTFVNGLLAEHYGIPGVRGDGWVRVDDADKYGRGGLLPMAVFLTKNAPGLRTSPVKRGYWVVKRVLGEEIPPPPAVVPELPRDEAKLDLPLRDKLAQHREIESCAACHARFDSMGLVFEGFGPIGERRMKDLAGHDVDVRASFPGGSEGAGVEGLREYVKAHRQDDFVDNMSRKMLAYGLGRSLMLSDDVLVEEMHNKLAASGYRFETLVESIVTSPQFLTKRGSGSVSEK